MTAPLASLREFTALRASAFECTAPLAIVFAVTAPGAMSPRLINGRFGPAVATPPSATMRARRPSAAADLLAEESKFADSMFDLCSTDSS